MRELVPAAQYVRMSTEHRRYSTENQSDAILQYAVRYGFEIVRTYADNGKNGLRLDGRDALKQLLIDVEGGSPGFKAVLVYDVSRWGRFQDADESAYYEYVCRRSGVEIRYCAEQFENDGSVASTILGQEQWEILSFSAIAEKDGEHRIETILGPRRFTRRRGQALYSDREPLEVLDRIRRTIGEYNFAGQYQQSPAPLGGGLVKAEWFKRYREDELPERFDRIVQSWDTANKATELSDFSVCTTWGVKDKNLFLISVFRRRLEYPALKRAVREQQSLFGATVVLIEDKASGTQLIQELITDGCYGVTRYQPTTDKIMRLHAQTAIIENGFVRIPETAPWLAEYLHELTVFPKGKHDDQANSTAQFLDWFKMPMPGWGIFELTRRQAQELEERRKPPPVKTVWAPSCMGVGRRAGESAVSRGD